MAFFGVVEFPAVDATAGLKAAWIAGEVEGDWDGWGTGVDMPGPGLVDAPSPGQVAAMAGLWSGLVAAMAGLWSGLVLVAVAVNRVVLPAVTAAVRVSVRVGSGRAGGARPGVFDVADSVLTCMFGGVAVVSDPPGRVVL